MAFPNSHGPVGVESPGTQGHEGSYIWIFTKVGFFSAVESSEPQPQLGLDGDVLSIRSRVEGDLDALRSAYAPLLGPTIMIPNRDYPYRAYITKEGFAAAMCRAVLDLSYSNFKSAVAQIQGHARAHLYHDVWAVMNGAERKLGQEGKGRKVQHSIKAPVAFQK